MLSEPAGRSESKVDPEKDGVVWPQPGILVDGNQERATDDRVFAEGSPLGAKREVRRVGADVGGIRSPPADEIGGKGDVAGHTVIRAGRVPEIAPVEPGDGDLVSEVHVRREGAVGLRG